MKNGGKNLVRITLSAVFILSGGQVAAFALLGIPPQRNWPFNTRLQSIFPRIEPNSEILIIIIIASVYM